MADASVTVLPRACKDCGRPDRPFATKTTCATCYMREWKARRPAETKAYRKAFRAKEDRTLEHNHRGEILRARTVVRRGETIKERRQRMDEERAARAAALKAQRRTEYAQRLIDKPWRDPALSESEQWAMRYRMDVKFNLSEKLRSVSNKDRRGGRLGELIRATIKRGGGSRKVEAALGYSLARLKDHLEDGFVDGMDWPAFLTGAIHIDHIRPLSSFDLTDEAQLKAAWSLGNLQPLWAADNLAKSAKWVTSDVAALGP